MAKEWGGRTFNEDWEPIDGQGNVTGGKDWQANREYAEANDPAGAWNFSPEVKSANPVAWDQTATGRAQRNQRTPTPYGGQSGGQGGGSAPSPSTSFAWDNPGDFGDPNQMSDPPWMGQGGDSPNQMSDPPGWMPGGRGGRAPGDTREFRGTGDQREFRMSPDMPWERDRVSSASSFALRTDPIPIDPRESDGSLSDGSFNTPSPRRIAPTPGVAPGPDGGALSLRTPDIDAAALMQQLQGPQSLGQAQGPQALRQMQDPRALEQLGAAPTVAAAGPTSQFGQSVQGSIREGLNDPSVDTNSPAYQAQVAAFQRNAQRAAERNRASTAQRMSAQGTLGGGGFDARVNRINQDQGAQEQDFEAQLMQSELNAGRERQARAQQLGAGLLSQEQQQGLTTRLANQSGALTGMGFNNQRDQSNQSAGLQMAGLNSGRDQSNQSAGLQMAALNSGRDQANLGAQMQTLGLNSGRDQANQGAQNQRNLALFGGRLQTGLANQGARMQQRGYNLQRDLGLRDLDLRGTQIGNQNDQYYSGLGQNLGIETARLNQQAMLALLGGG